jgi:hypothetical protein
LHYKYKIALTPSVRAIFFADRFKALASVWAWAWVSAMAIKLAKQPAAEQPLQSAQ